MKKRLLAIVLCLSTLMLMQGCSLTQVLDKGSDMLVSATESETSTEEVYKIPQKEEVDLSPSVEPTNMDPIPLVFGNDLEVTYVYPDGTFEGTYELPSYSTLIGFDGYTVYYYAYDANYEGDEKEVLYSYDVKTKADKEICRIEFGSFMIYYDGKIWFLAYDDNSKYKEYSADVTTGVISETSEISDVLDRYSARHDYDYKFSSKRFFDEAGYILLYDTDRTYMYDKDAVVALSLPEDTYDTVYWDKNSVFLTTMSDYDGISTFSRYDVKDATTTVISDKYQGTLAVFDGKLYWYECERQTDGETHYPVYYIDLNTYETGDAVTLRRTPGTSEYFNILDTFTPCETGYFYADCDYGKINWNYTYRSVSGYDVTNNALTKPIREHKWNEIGQVQAAYCENYCPMCGKKIEEYYEEHFILNESLSAHAKDINDALYARFQANMDNYASSDTSYIVDDSECDIHGTYMGMSSYEHTVFDAKIIKDHYLTVDMDGYMYMGGAHGLPFTGHYLFDLNTGRELLLSDLYNGSNEQLKELVATKVRENLLSYKDGEYAPFYETDPDALYQSVYEDTEIDTLPVGFSEDSLYIDYQPYQMGPFAAGFIVIEISYDDIDLKWD